MQNVKQLPPLQGVTEMEEFHVDAKGNKIVVGGTFRYSRSFVAEWIWRVAVIVVLGWNGTTLKGLTDNIADRIVEKIVSRSGAVPAVKSPAINQTADDAPPVAPAKPRRSRRPPAVQSPPGPQGVNAAGELSGGNLARVSPVNVDLVKWRE